MAQNNQSKYVCVGCITGAHGIKGCVKVRSFTEDPLHMNAYGPLLDEEGQFLFDLEPLHMAKDTVLVARIEGVTSREAAEKLKNTNLYVPRSVLPEVEEETYYHSDLIGLTVLDSNKTPVGHVKEVHDFGAGILLEIEQAGQKTFLIPFKQETVPVVDLKEGHIQVDAETLEAFSK